MRRYSLAKLAGRLTGTRIFCIGFNKTGTRSLHSFFQQCQLSSLHNDRWTHYSKVRWGWLYFLINQCYTDGELSDFATLDRWFPGSVFILNKRDERDWLRSRVKHVLRFNERVDAKSVLTSKQYGKMARDFFTNERDCLQKWISEHRVYLQKARNYFQGSKRFCEVDLPQEPDWDFRLIRFLNENGVQARPSEKALGIHQHRRDVEAIHDTAQLEMYFTMIDEALGAGEAMR